MKQLYTFIFCAICFYTGHAQLDLQCDGRDAHALYLLVNDSGYFRVDNVDTNPSDPVQVASEPIDAEGISINRRLDTTGNITVMYAVGGSPRKYSYWDGNNWINTGHGPGDTRVINPGGTNNYIFNLAGIDNEVYRYDGTGNGTLLLSFVPSAYGSVYDIATDKGGNFYIFYTAGQFVIMYNPNGVPMDTFTTTGNPTNVMAGFAIIGNRMYTVNDTAIYEGIVSGSTIAFHHAKSLTYKLQSGDIAACPEAGEVLSVFKNPEAPHFAIYPNPASGSAVIKLDNATTIDVTDALGRQVQHIEVKGLTEYRLSLNGWVPGVYYVSVVSPGGVTAHSTLVVR